MLSPPEGQMIIQTLSIPLKCGSTPRAVFTAAYDWYYVPRSEAMQKLAQQVIEDALREYSESQIIPAWVKRVHERYVLNLAFDEGESVSHPMHDPKYADFFAIRRPT